jgi:hypothetical protein
VRRVQPGRVRGLTWASDIGRANRFTRCIRSANRAMGCRRLPHVSQTSQANGKGLQRGIGVWNTRASPSRVYSLAVGVGFGPALLFAF